MKFKKFIEVAKKTECTYDEGTLNRINPRLLHAIMGISDEAGELTGQLKKHLFYGKPLDTVNLIEECGDLMYFMAVLIDELDRNYIPVDFDDILRTVKSKLEVRYKGGNFNQDNAINRDLDAERANAEKQLGLNT